MGYETIKKKLAWLAGRTEVRVAAAYLVFGSLWIALSDRLLFALVNTEAAQQAIAMYKGWAFVGVSALLFYALLRVETRRVSEAEARLRALNEELEEKIGERTAMLADSNAELEDLYNNAPCGYHSLDKDGVFIKINDMELRMLGYERHEVVGRLRFEELLTPASLAVFRANFPNFLKTGSVKDLEFELRRKGGGVIDVLVSATAVKGADGSYRHSRSVVFDISEKKRTQDELARYARTLEAANKELEAFSYSVSHDLRSPLRGIDGFSKILEDDYGARLDAEARRLIGVIRANAARMAELIEDLLSFARAAKKEMLPGRVDMDALAREAWREAAPEGWPGRLEIGPLPPALGDAALLRQVLVNLLSNAVKFTGKTAFPTIKVSGSGGRIGEYAVSDNGAGFDPAAAGRLFGIFQRLHTEAEFKGTGVGLAIVNRIILRHGGAVRAEGRPGAGATFFFTLPGLPGEGRA